VNLEKKLFKLSDQELEELVKTANKVLMGRYAYRKLDRGLSPGPEIKLAQIKMNNIKPKEDINGSF
jgi:hypothetical protein